MSSMLRSFVGSNGGNRGSPQDGGSPPKPQAQANGNMKYNLQKKSQGAEEQTSHGATSEEISDQSTSENEYRRNQKQLTEEEYEFIARDIMAKPPVTGYLKYHLPLRYAARAEEVRWVWNDPNTGKLTYKELIGGGKNSDLEYD